LADFWVVGLGVLDSLMDGGVVRFNGCWLCGAELEEFVVEEDAGFVRRRHPLFMVWTPGQSIGFVESAGFVHDGEVKTGKEQRPSGLTTGKFLLCHKIGKVVMVGPDFEGIGVSFEVVAKSLEGADDSEEFLIVDVVVKFRRLHGFGKERDRVPSIKEIWLFEDCAKGVVTGVCDDTERTGGIREGEDWGNGKGVDEGAKGGFLGGGPSKGDVFLGEGEQGMGNLGVVFDKTSIEVAKTQE